MAVITRSLVLIAATFGMGLSALMCSADVLQRVGDDYTARAVQETGDVRQSLLTQAVEAYRLAQQLEPWQPLHAFKMGVAYEFSATTLAPLSNKSQFAWASAAASYGQAVLLHPANGRLQAALAWATLPNRDLISSRRAAHAALKLAPDYPDVRYMVARWYLTQWEVLSAEDQRLTIALVQRGVRELPEQYLELTWQLLGNTKTVRSILPSGSKVRRLLLNKLTERGLFAERWAEQMDHPYLRVQTPAKGLHVLARGQLFGRQEPPPQATTTGPWTGMVGGWLSEGLMAKVDLNLPPGKSFCTFPCWAS